MCWHDLKRFCCCLDIKQGSYITTSCHTIILILLLVESWIQPEYSELPWIAAIIQNLRFEKSTHLIALSILAGTGWFKVFWPLCP
jgi:hypothetical protein